MKLFLSIFACLLIKVVMADTLDYWVIYKNEEIIKKITSINDTSEIVIKFDNNKSYDSLIVRYYPDTPCIECGAKLILMSDNGDNIDINIVYEMPSSLKFPLNVLKRKALENSSKYFDIYYLETGITGWANKPKQYLFRLRLQ